METFPPSQLPPTGAGPVPILFFFSIPILLSLFSFFPTQICGEFLAFWEVWGFLPAFSRCSVVVPHVEVLLMYLWGGRWSPRLTPPPSWRSLLGRSKFDQVGWGPVGEAMLRNPVKDWSSRGYRNISHVFAHTPWPLFHRPSLILLVIFLCLAQPTLHIPSLSYTSFSFLFLSFPSCQNQLRSHHLWEHSETLQLELIITSSVSTVIVLPLHYST